MSKLTKAFYATQAWKDTRRNYIKSVGGLCERCLSKGIIEPAVIVHHKVALTPENVSDLNVSLSWNNLQALCRKCHAEVHEEMYMARTGRRYKIDELGRVYIQDDNLL